MSLLKEPVFIGMCLSVTLMSVGCPYMLYFLPAYALSKGKFDVCSIHSVFSTLLSQLIVIKSNIPRLTEKKGFTKKEAGLLVAVSAALDLVGRLGLGYLSDLQIFDRKKAFIVW